MNKTILVNGYVGKKITGIGRTLIELLKRMDDGTTNFVIYANFDNEQIIELNGGHIEVKTIGISKESVLLNLLFNTFIFPFIALKRRYSVVYISNFMPIFFKFKPTVVVIHDLIEFNVKEKFSKLRMLYRKTIVPTMAKRSDKIITVSNYSKSDIIKFFNINENKIEVVYNSYLQESLNEDKPPVNEDSFVERFGFRSKKYFLYVGTIDYPGKNIHNLIHGYEHFKSSQSDLEHNLVLCGMPGKGSEVVMELMGNSKYKDDIKYLGFVNDEDLELIYRNAVLTVFASYYEGFGLPVIESMQYGIPVITSNRSCLPEIAGDAGFIVDADDYKQIGDAMFDILSITDMPALQEKMAKNIERFSWEDSAKKTLRVFGNVS